MSRTPETKSALFSASREAEVATKRTRSAPSSSMTSAYSRQAAKVRSSASGASRPVLSEAAWPRRTIVIRRSSWVKEPVAGSASSDVSRMEFVPQSTAATLVMRPALRRGRRRDGRRSGPRRPRPPSQPSSSFGTHGVTHAPLAHHSGSIAMASSPSGFTPGPAASEWPTRTCRHFTRSGMPPALGKPSRTSMASRRVM
ncbi:hypothetical protein SCYAM73S_05427 [Streptomyces cyaneofuscatus]